MLYGGFDNKTSYRQRSTLLSSLMNPMRESDLNKDKLTSFRGPAGPEYGSNFQRQSFPERNSDWHRKLPPIPRSYHLRNANIGKLSLEPPRVAAIDIGGPRNPYYAPLSRSKYEEKPLDPKAHAAQKLYLDQLEQFKSSPLVSNIMRNPDLNQYERLSLGLESLNVDQLRLLRGLPVGTDLYRYKVEQSKELGTVRGEVMKIAEEQRLKAMKKGLDLKFNEEDRGLENKMWADEQLKTIIQKKIRESLNKEQNIEFN